MDGMDHGHDMGGMGGMGGMTAPPPAPPPHRKMMMMHMTFFWGSKTEVLFDGWPGTSTAQYAVSLAVIFLTAVLVEWLSRSQIVKAAGIHRPVSSGLLRTFMHAVRMGLAYLVMLAVMSFNGGVFLAAVAGHAVGFLVFGTRVLGKSGKDGDGLVHGNPDLPAMSC